MGRKKIFHLFFYILCLGLAFFLFCFILSRFLERKIDNLYEDRASQVRLAYGLKEKDRGLSLAEKALANEELLILGSSELSSEVPENPRNYFPNNLYQHCLTISGRAHVQNFNHALFLGANSNCIQNNDVVIVESLQWFTGYERYLDGAMSHMSELHFCEFLNNDRISQENKDYLCDRFILLSEARLGQKCLPSFSVLGRFGQMTFFLNELDYPQTYLYAKLYRTETFAGKTLYTIMQPYFYLRHQFLLLKDKFDAYRYLEETAPCPQSQQPVEINWETMYSVAEAEGRAACTNNGLFVEDDYFSTYLSPSWDTLKDSHDYPLMVSREWQDYDFFLSICNDLGIKPYVVIMSTNGAYYDYVGIKKTERDELYDTLEFMAAQHGIPALNLKGHEYEPYFFSDIMHLGWRGWTHVTQQIIEHFSE